MGDGWGGRRAEASLLSGRPPGRRGWRPAHPDSLARGLGPIPVAVRPAPGTSESDPDQDPPADAPAGGECAHLSCPRPLWWCGRCPMSPEETGRQGQHSAARPAKGPGARGLGGALAGPRDAQAPGLHVTPGPTAHVPRQHHVRGGKTLLGQLRAEGARPDRVPRLLGRREAPRVGGNLGGPAECGTPTPPSPPPLSSRAWSTPPVAWEPRCCPSDNKAAATHPSPSSQAACPPEGVPPQGPEGPPPAWRTRLRALGQQEGLPVETQDSRHSPEGCPGSPFPAPGARTCRPQGTVVSQ